MYTPDRQINPDSFYEEDEVEYIDCEKCTNTIKIEDMYSIVGFDCLCRECFKIESAPFKSK